MVKKLFLLLVLICCFVSAEITFAQTVSSGWLATATNYGGARYRNFGGGTGWDVRLWDPRDPNDYHGSFLTLPGNWYFDGTPNPIIFGYDNTTGLISTSVTNNHSSSPFSTTFNMGIQNPLNYMQIGVVERATSTNVDFNNVYLNGISLGNFTAPGNTWNNWYVWNYDFSQGFTLIGDLVINGTTGGQETNKLEIRIGYDPTLPTGVIPEPGTILLLGSGFLGLGLIGWYRRRKA